MKMPTPPSASNRCKRKNTCRTTALNYAYASKGNYTYYCYTDSTNPTVLITVDDIANAGRASLSGITLKGDKGDNTDIVRRVQRMQTQRIP